MCVACCCLVLLSVLSLTYTLSTYLRYLLRSSNYIPMSKRPPKPLGKSDGADETASNPTASAFYPKEYVVGQGEVDG